MQSPLAGHSTINRVSSEESCEEVQTGRVVSFFVKY